MFNRFKKGFTIIELIVVIAIVAVLSAIVMAGVSNYQVKARNAIRKTELRVLQKALTAYFADNGSYPITTGRAGCNSDWCGVSGNGGSYGVSGSNGYIPNLAPTYIGVLPVDPTDIRTGWGGYPYKSDGINYKLLSHPKNGGDGGNPGPEGTLSATDPFYDNIRSGYAWMICTGDPTACGW